MEITNNSELTSDDVHGQILDHFGLISAKMDQLNLIKNIDTKIPVSSNKGSKVSMGERVAAMVLNGLGFVNDRLYMFPDFLENKAVDVLFDKNIKASDFNDDALGRCLDAIHKYGTSKFVSEIALEIGKEEGLLGKCTHVDTTTLTVYGDYNNETTKGAIPKHGYSKQKRMDLKQVVLLLATTGKAGLPVWMCSHNGNASDQKTLLEASKRIDLFYNQLKGAPSFIYVADSAMYNSCIKDNSNISWLSRVPENIKKSSLLLEQDSGDFSWSGVDGLDGYKISATTSDYGGIKQRWLLVYSEQAFKRESKTLDKRISKELEDKTKELNKLSKQVIGCYQDAQKIAKELKKTIKYHSVTFTYEAIYGYSKKGKPKPDALKEIKGYKIIGSLEQDKEKILLVRRKKGRFILATNELSIKKLSDTEILTEYKDQSQVERGFKFIKDDTFELDSIFLKKPERIDALMAVMTITLMVYNLSQHHLRESLKKTNESLLNQLKKPTQKPTIKWIFKKFEGVQVLYVNLGDKTKRIVINVSPFMKQVVRHFGDKAMKIYETGGFSCS